MQIPDIINSIGTLTPNEKRAYLTIVNTSVSQEQLLRKLQSTMTTQVFELFTTMLYELPSYGGNHKMVVRNRIG